MKADYRFRLTFLAILIAAASLAAQQAPDRTHPPEPVARLAEALPIMGDVALRPTFPKEELERQRQQRLTNIIQARDDPPTIAAAGFSRLLYGRGHRYGTPSFGTAETIKAFTTEDLRAFYNAAFRPDNAALLAVGDLTSDHVMP